MTPPRAPGLPRGLGISPGRLLNKQATPQFLTFISPVGLVHPMTRTHVELLGPCFKTGRVVHRLSHYRRGKTARSRLKGVTKRRRPPRHSLNHRRAVRICHRGFPPSPAPASGEGGEVPIHPGLRRPQQWLRQSTSRRNTPSDAGVKNQRRSRVRGEHGTRASRPLGPADAVELNPLISIYEFHPFRLLTVSRTIELSLQSSFQLSLTVLVRYRSRGHI